MNSNPRVTFQRKYYVNRREEELQVHSVTVRSKEKKQEQ